MEDINRDCINLLRISIHTALSPWSQMRNVEGEWIYAREVQLYARRPQLYAGGVLLYVGEVRLYVEKHGYMMQWF